MEESRQRDGGGGGGGGGSQKIRAKVRKPTEDSSSSDNHDITEPISSCTVSADVPM